MKKLMLVMLSAAGLIAVGSAEARARGTVVAQETEVISKGECCGHCHKEHKHCSCKTEIPDCKKFVEVREKPQVITSEECISQCPEGYETIVLEEASCPGQCRKLKCFKNIVSEQTCRQINTKERTHTYVCPNGTEEAGRKAIAAAAINSALAAGQQPEIPGEVNVEDEFTLDEQPAKVGRARTGYAARKAARIGY